MVAAAIVTTQGMTSSAAGQSLIGALGSFTCANNNNAGVAPDGWRWEILDVPAGSAVAVGIVSDGATQTMSATADVAGGYSVRLIVTDAAGNQSVDVRVFQVPQASGRIIPPCLADIKAVNFGGETRGWSPYLEAWLKFVDGTRAQASVAGTGAVTLSAAQCSTSVVELTGVLTGARTVSLPNIDGMTRLVRNLTTGAFALTVKALGGTALVQVPQGSSVLVTCNGVDLAAVAGGGGGVTTVDTLANILALPSPAKGDRGEASDYGWPLIFNGTIWQPRVGGRLCTMPPTVASAVWTPFGTPGAFADDRAQIRLAMGGANDGAHKGAYTPLTTNTTTGVIELGFRLSLPIAFAAQKYGFGAKLYESGTGKAWTYGFALDMATGFLSDLGGYAATIGGASLTAPGGNYAASWVQAPVFFITVSFESGNVVGRASNTGDQSTLGGGNHTVAKATAFTTAPDNIGIYQPDATQIGNAVHLFHMLQR